MGKISLQKNNKYFGRRAIGLREILAGVVAFLIVGTSMVLSGCGFPRKAEAAATDTPEVAQTANPTITPTLKPTEVPTPAPSPTNSPMPELTKEQKNLLLGINNKFSNYTLGNITTYYVKFNDKNYRLWTVSVIQENSLKEDVYSIFNMEYLFTIDVPNENTRDNKLSEYLGKTNPLLNGIELVHSVGINRFASHYKYWGLDYNNNKYLEGINEKFSKGTIEEGNSVLKTPITKEKILELYFDTTPQEEIMPFWMYTEGATIPDELKGIFTTPAATVAPTLFRDGNASVKYLMGERDLDTEIENKTKRM